MSIKLYACFLIVILSSIAILSVQSPLNPTVEAQSTLLPPRIDCWKATPQIDDPVEMNTVKIDAHYIRTLYAEKEIFACHKPGSPIEAIDKYRDITLFIQLVARDNGGVLILFRPQVNATVCERDPSGEILSCNSSLITSRPQSLSGCVEESPVLPLEMNTIYSNESGSVLPMKSIIAEKHSYKCISGNSTVPDKVKETILFTLQGSKRLIFVSPGTPSIIGPNYYVAFECFKDIGSAFVESCDLYNPPVLNPSRPS